ncbi:MAG: Trk system potassium transporter TrkA [Lachnospiraceae bacterium]|nr:Trk system potassium transporter TrkA [Lachnospiraceae bacterium]
MKFFGDKKTDEVKALNIIIVGCGKVGATLTYSLSNEGNNVTMIDISQERIDDITNQYDVMGYVGNGASYSTLKEVGVDDADLFIAVTGSDELNLLCCTVATRVGKCSAIARVRTPDYNKEINYLRDRLELAMIINPEFEAALEIARILYLPSALEVGSFAHGEAEMIKFKLAEDSPLDGKQVAQISHGISQRFLFTAVQREDKVIIPNGLFTLEAGDVVSIVTPRRQGRSCLNALGVKTPHVRDALIVGGGKGAYYLATQLIHEGIEVKIIERDTDRCEELSVLLPEAIIINGNGTDEALLYEAGIETVGAFVPLTGIDEENIMLTLHAKGVSETKVVTKVNRFAFHEVINSLDLGSIVYPRIITSEYILAFARAKRASMDSAIETLYHMYDGAVEAIEFKIENESPITGVKLKHLRLKKNVMVSFINRNGRIIFPTGDDTIEVGDTMMIVTTNSGFNDISDILD